MLSAGQQLRTLRERLGLTMRDVEAASLEIARRHGNDAYALSLSRLCDLEIKGIVPSIFRIYTLAVLYRCSIRDILAWYGVDMADSTADLDVVAPPKSHLSQAVQNVELVRVPIQLDPAFDLRQTTNLGRMVEQWGLVPLTYLSQFTSTSFTYGYVGSEDFTMYPLLMPGSFVQVDESKNRVATGMWNSEYERPIYFVETREGYTCCWCDLRGENLVMQPHPLSPAPVRILKHAREAEVIGQIVGMAMRLGEWKAFDSLRGAKGRQALT